MKTTNLLQVTRYYSAYMYKMCWTLLLSSEYEMGRGEVWLLPYDMLITMFNSWKLCQIRPEITMNCWFFSIIESLFNKATPSAMINFPYKRSGLSWGNLALFFTAVHLKSGLIRQMTFGGSGLIKVWFLYFGCLFVVNIN